MWICITHCRRTFNGLRNQLAKIYNSSLDTDHSARNLGFIFFDEHPTFSKPVTPLSNVCFYHIQKLRCIRPYLDSLTACTIATSVVHSELDYCNSLYYKLPKSQLSCIQHTQKSLDRTVVNAPKYCHITTVSYALSTGSESSNASNTSSSYLPTKFSQPPNLHTFITSSQFNVLAVIALHPSLLLLGHRHHSLYKQLIAPFVMLRLVSGINSLYRFVNLILLSVPPFPTHLSSPISSSSFDSPLCSSITPSLFYSRL